MSKLPTSREDIAKILSEYDLHVYDMISYNMSLIKKSIETYRTGILDCEYDISVLEAYVLSNLEALMSLKKSSLPPIDEIKKIKNEIKIVQTKIKYLKEQCKTFEQIISDRTEELNKNQRQLKKLISNAMSSKIIPYEVFKSRRNQSQD